MKMLVFDFRESEKEYFNTHNLSDFEIEFIKEPLNELSNLTERQLSETVAISVFITSEVNETIIKNFKNLRMISTRSTGYDHIDLKYCTQNNIAVFNVENYGEKSVAQYTFMLILALVRKLIPAYIDVQKNLVNYEIYEGRNLEQLSIGILGGGSIGSSVAKIANFFNMKVYLCSYEKNPELKSFAEYLSFDELLTKSDIITLHLPYNAETFHIINENSLKKVKKGAFIINTARGELIDIVALYNSLLAGDIGGAALDVIECDKIAVSEKPIIPNNSSSDCLTKALVTQKLLGMPNVIVTPHIAYNTKESIKKILDVTFNSLRDFCKGMHSNQLR